ncbi:cyclic nucleotide-binding protein [Shewanella putrefaciens]|nr:cyclic nucleotide-binding domain-containing protein [Shewanella putrefaciens]AVV82682.1 cyclic nucleotide-binding protein [Shewanella putrefaciens]
MQLKPLAKGRYSQRWEQDYPLIEAVILSCISEVKMLKKGAHLMTQGEAMASLVLVKQGRVSLGHTARNGRCFQLGTIDCDSQLFGEMEFFTQYHCQLDIIANEPLEIMIISAEKLQCSLGNIRSLRYFSPVPLLLTTKTPSIFLPGDCFIPSAITWHMIFTMNI